MPSASRRAGRAEVGGARLLGRGLVGPGDLQQQRVQGGHVPAGQPVVDAGSLAPGGHQAGLLEGLQAGRGCAQAQPGRPGQRVDAAFALGQQVQQLQALAVRERLAGDRDGLEQDGLARRISHSIHHYSME